MVDNKINDQLDLKVELTKVHGDMEKLIGKNYVLAKSVGGLTEKDKEAITELLHSAYSNFIILELLRQKKYYRWNQKKEEYEWQDLSKEEKERIKKLQGYLLRVYLVRPDTATTLNINVPGNNIYELMFGKGDEERLEEQKEKIETKKFGDRMKNFLKKEKE